MPRCRLQGARSNSGPPPGKIVKHLVGLDVAAVGQTDQILHLVGVEIADAPMPDLAGLFQRLESRDRLSQRDAARPMQQIEIDAVGAQALQAVLAGALHAGARGVGGQHLRDQESLVAAPGNGLRHHFLGAAAGIHFSGIDQRDAKIEAELQGVDFTGTAAGILAHLPRALPENRYGFAGGQRGGSDDRWHGGLPLEPDRSTGRARNPEEFSLAPPWRKAYFTGWAASQSCICLISASCALMTASASLRISGSLPLASSTLAMSMAP